MTQQQKPDWRSVSPKQKPAWPLQTDRDAFYGNPRSRDVTKASAKWESENLVLISVPFVMRFDGRPIRGVRIHKRCADSLTRVLDEIWVNAGRTQTAIDTWGVSQFGGSYNYRLVRGGTSLSSHSWGCAIDLDPARNGLGDATPNFANIPEVLEPFFNQGWTWGGNWSRPDGMHWQAAGVR